MPINLPTQVTLLRLGLAIVFFVLISQHSQRQPRIALLYVCLATFIVAAATDYVDGYLARKHNQVTALGRMLDPFVDKVLVCGAFIFLAGPGFCRADGQNVTGLVPWMLVIILGRELLVTGLRGFSESQGVRFGAELVGKAKMWIQTLTVIILLFSIAYYGDKASAGVVWVRTIAVWLTVVVTAASLLTYLIKARSLLNTATRT